MLRTRFLLRIRPRPIIFQNASRCVSNRRQRLLHQNIHEERFRNARPLVPHAVGERFQNMGSDRKFKVSAVAVALLAVAFYFYNSKTVPITGRRQFNYLSDEMVARVHRRDAEMVIREVQRQGGHFLSEWDPRTILVKRVMKRLIPLSGLQDLDWEVHVIADSSKLLVCGFVKGQLLTNWRQKQKRQMPLFSQEAKYSYTAAFSTSPVAKTH